MLTDLISTGNTPWFVLAHGAGQHAANRGLDLGPRCASRVDLYKKRMQERQRPEFKHHQSPELLGSAPVPSPTPRPSHCAQDAIEANVDADDYHQSKHATMHVSCRLSF